MTAAASSPAAWPCARGKSLPVPWGVLGTITAAGMGGLLWFLLVEPDISYRIYLMSLALAGISLTVLAKLWRVEMRNFIDRLLFWVTLVTCVGSLLRPAAIFLLIGHFDTYDAVQQTLYWSTVQFTQALVSVVVALNLLVAVARFSRTLATLLASGVQLLQAMEIGKNVLENARLEQVVSEAIGSIREGESIAVPLKRSGQFPPMMTHMIAVGEKSGQLEPMLENVSRAYEADVETRVVALTSLLEPIMIVALGGAVGFIAMSILMPLLQMNELVE